MPRPFRAAMKTGGVVIRHATEPCPPERAFRFVDGRSARSLTEFAEVLAGAPEGVVDYHRSHFEPWLRDVVGDGPLADRVAQYAAAGTGAGDFRRVVRDLAAARLAELAEPPADAAPTKKRLMDRFRAR